MNDYITKIDNFIAPVATFGSFRLARVGGSVRDEILGRKAKDADYVAFGVSLRRLGVALQTLDGAAVTPLKLRDGRQAGWRVFKKGYGLIEIMLPRTEISTGSGHRDFEIIIDHTLTPEQDAKRRDFTFNALYKWIGHEPIVVEFGDDITDPTGRGLYDLQHKLVNTTHSDSFRDDPLRILRALRFVSVLGYDLSSMAEDEMVQHALAAHGLSAVYKDAETKTEAASGTVLDEMSKLLMGDDVGKALRLMRDTGVMAVVLPELAAMLGFEQGSKYHDLTTDEHTFVALEAAAAAEAPLHVRWALLFHDAGKPAVAWTGTDGRKHYYAYAGPDPDATDAQRRDHEAVSEELWRRFAARANVPKSLREDAATLIRNHMVTLQPRNAGVKVRRMRVQFGDEMLAALLLHRACDCMGKKASATAQLRKVQDLVALQHAARDAGVPASVKDLQISGKDILDKGLWGAAVGNVLKAILDEVVCQPDEQRMSREWQEKAIDRWIEYYRKRV